MSFCRFQKRESSDSGVAIVELALLVPVIIVMAIVIFDLARLYINYIYAREIALLGAKIANSSDPDGYAFTDSDISRFYLAPSGEAGSVTAKRKAFWTNQLDDTPHPDYWGLDYFPSKDKEVLNLLYGFAMQLNPRMYFPIPEPLNSADPVSDLGGRVNCSIKIDFAPGSAPPAQSTWSGLTASALTTEMNMSRDRIITVRCAVPMIGIQLLTLGGEKVRYVSANGYAYKAGNINP